MNTASVKCQWQWQRHQERQISIPLEYIVMLENWSLTHSQVSGECHNVFLWDPVWCSWWRCHCHWRLTLGMFTALQHAQFPHLLSSRIFQSFLGQESMILGIHYIYCKIQRVLQINLYRIYCQILKTSYKLCHLLTTAIFHPSQP